MIKRWKAQRRRDARLLVRIALTDGPLTLCELREESGLRWGRMAEAVGSLMGDGSVESVVLPRAGVATLHPLEPMWERRYQLTRRNDG